MRVARARAVEESDSQEPGEAELAGPHAAAQVFARLNKLKKYIAEAGIVERFNAQWTMNHDASRIGISGERRASRVFPEEVGVQQPAVGFRRLFKFSQRRQQNQRSGGIVEHQCNWNIVQLKIGVAFRGQLIILHTEADGELGKNVIDLQAKQ